MSFLITIFALGLVIFLHELGHMLMAKRAGIGVYEFSVGMGPKIYAKQYGETLYSLRLLPLGGFVKLAGLDDDKENPAPPDKSFNEKSVGARFLTIAAGSVMNIILGFVIFVLMFSIIGVPKVNNVISEVLPNSPAQAQQLQPGDTIVSINGLSIDDPQKDIIGQIHQSADKKITITYRRNDVTNQISIIPKPYEKNPKVGLIGILLDSTTQRYNPITSIGLGMKETYTRVKLVFLSLSMLVNGQAGLKDMAGPIGIIQLASFQLSRSFLNFLDMMALISISLGVINLFPFPVLDGGHLLLLLIESIRRKRISQKWETAVNNIGAAVLISLMVIIIINDIINWESRVQFLQNLTR